MDQFNVYDLITQKNLTPQAVSQLEVEIFPQVAEHILENPKRKQEFDDFIAKLEKRMGGQSTTQPKYQNQNKLEIKPSIWDPLSVLE